MGTCNENTHSLKLHDKSEYKAWECIADTLSCNQSTQTSKLGETALHAAAHADNVALCRFLVEHGLQVDEKDNEGQTPLHWAAMGPGYNAATWLVAQGANPDARDIKNKTPADTAENIGLKEAAQWFRQLRSKN